MNERRPEQQALLLDRNPVTDGAPSIDSQLPQHSIPKAVSDVEIDTASTGTSKRSNRRDGYHPLWLRKRTLCSLIALFAALAAALLILWKESQIQDGFATFTSNHYTWTYGPTAVLVVVLSLWRQVDYYCKALQPWQELYKGPSKAERSVMLDYIAPLNITSFTKAVRFQHWPVAASIAGFAIMKLIILFSTGLLVLSPTTLEYKLPIKLTTKFDGTRFWGSVGDGGPQAGHILGLEQAQHAYGNVSTLPITRNIDLLEKERVHPETVSTLDTMAFQHFNISSDSLAQTVWVDVDVFFPNTTCEIADSNLSGSTLVNGGTTTSAIKLRTKTCSVKITENSLTASSKQIADNDGAASQIMYGVWKVNCSDPLANYTANVTLTSQTPYDVRHAFIVSNATTINVATAHPDSLMMDNPIHLHNSAVVICRPDYFISKTRVTYDVEAKLFSVGRPSKGAHMSNLTPTILGEVMYSTAYLTEGVTLIAEGGGSSPLGLTEALFHNIVHAQDGEKLLANLLDAQHFQKAAFTAYAGISTQLMKEDFLMEAADLVDGTGVYVQDKLQVSLVSLWVMIVGFILMILLSLCIVITTTQGVVPCDPGTVLTSAKILSHSPSLQEQLRSAGSLRTSQLRTLLVGSKFWSPEHGGFRIHTDGASLAPSLSPSKNINKKGSWIPVAARYPMVSLTFTAPILVIVLLEILYRLSEQHEGIAETTGHENISQSLSRYLSALTMLLLATNFNALDFAISSFAPYSLLRSGNSKASRVHRSQILGELPPIALWRCLAPANHQLRLTTTNVAGMIGSTLTIIASGLWVLDRNVIREVPVTASLVDSFNVTWHNSSFSGDGGAVALLDEVQHGLASMPITLWNDFAIPSISHVRTGPDSSGQVTNLLTSSGHGLVFQVNAVRPELSCEIVADQYINITEEFTHDTSSAWQQTKIWAKPPMPPACQHNGPNGTSKFASFSEEVLISLNVEGDPPYLAAFTDIHLGPYDNDSIYMNAPGSGELYHYRDNPAGCPSIGVIFSHLTGKRTAHSNVTVLVCSQKLQQAQLNIPYDSARLQTPNIIATTAPVPDLGTAQYLTNGTNGIDTFPYRVETYLQATDHGGGLTSFGTYTVGNTFEGFFDQLVYGPNGTAVDSLTGIANRANFIKAVQALYNKYMSLVIDMKFRQPLPPGSEERVVHGTIKVTTSRLKVNNTSKITLQVLLGIMTLLGMTAFLLTDLRGTLPRSPCSIASAMAFLACSELCSKDGPLALLPLNASQKEIEKALEGYMFSLGWWDLSKAEITATEAEVTSLSSSCKTEKHEPRRFGIDIGMPAQLGFRETKLWKMRRRLAGRPAEV